MIIKHETIRKKLYNAIHRVNVKVFSKYELKKKKSKARCFEGALFFSSEGVPSGSPPFQRVLSAILCDRKAGWKSGSSLRCRRKLTRIVTSAQQRRDPCFWVLHGLKGLPEMRFKFPSNLIGKSKMAFFTGQSWRVLESWYTGGDPEQGFRRCFADGLNQSQPSISSFSEIPGQYVAVGEMTR